MKVRWTRPATNDLGDIGDFIAMDNPAAAVRVGKAIQAAVDGLSNYPFIGRPGRIDGTRELVEQMRAA
jgi:toxin ParE1/3/4